MQPSLLTFLLLLVLPGRKTANISKSVVTLHPPWFRVLINDLVTLRCEGPGASEDNSILWFHNDTIIPVQIQDYNITADNITYSGKYQCQIGQLALSDPVTLEVFQDWLLLQTLKLVYMKGEPMVLRCHSWENRVISKITFFQNGKWRKYSSRDSNFTINQVNYNDSGNYFCSANIGNRREESKIVKITVQAICQESIHDREQETSLGNIFRSPTHRKNPPGSDFGLESKLDMTNAMYNLSRLALSDITLV